MLNDLATWVGMQLKTPEDDGVSLLVVSLSKDGERSVLGRLGDLGVGPGEEIRYFGRAPLGEPIYICVRDTVVALRLGEAALIQVESAG